MHTSFASAGPFKVAAAMLLSLAAGAASAQGRFTVSADGQEVFDTSTQLTWRRCAEGTTWDGTTCTGKPLRFKLADAKEHAGAAPAPGGAKWRLPSREELVGLMDMKSRKKPHIDAMAFPKTPSLPFWATRSGSEDNLNAWLVSFASGKVQGNVGQAKFPVRLVRSAV